MCVCGGVVEVGLIALIVAFFTRLFKRFRSRTFEFSLIITRPTVDEETAADMLYGGGCDDALFSVSNGQYEIAFSRRAESLDAAVYSAIDQVIGAGIGSRIITVMTGE